MISRRGVLALPALSGAAAVVGLAAEAEAAAAAAPTVTELGVPLSDVLLIGGTVGRGPAGDPVLWSASTGEPGRLNAIDPQTGHTVSTQSLDSPGSYAVVVAPDGTVYVGCYGNGNLYRRRPGPASPLENLGPPLASENFIQRLAVDEAGRVFGGTYPTGKVFSVDGRTGAVRDYGQLLPGLQYVKSIAVWRGKIYAGTHPDARLFEIDIATGARRELPLPAEVGTGVGVTVYDFNAYDNRLFVRFGAATSGRLGVYDLRTGTWSPLITDVAGLDVSEPGRRGEVYLTRAGRLTALDPRTGALTGTDLTFAGRVVNNRGIGWVNLRGRDFPGQTLVGLLWRGALFRYNPITRYGDVLQTDVPGEPTPIAALHVTASGTLYAGGFLSGGLAAIAPDTGASSFQRFAQVESIREIDGQIYIGAYPDSRLYRYDPTKPWSSTEYSPGPAGTPENPVKLVDLVADHQVRARALTDAGSRVAYGTMPSTELGGVLVVVDKATGTNTRHRPVVVDQSIVSLAYAQGLIVGGTSIHGGYTTPEPTQTEARLFGWDAAAAAKVFELTPVPGAEAVPALAVDRNGLVWGLAAGQLFTVDVATRQVTASRVLNASAGGDATGELGYHAPSHTLYALVRDRYLWRIDLAGGEAVQVLDRPASHLAVHPDGRLFLSHDENLSMVTTV